MHGHKSVNTILSLNDNKHSRSSCVHINSIPSSAVLRVYGQGHLYVPVRPRPANKLCPLNFSISTCINFHLKNKKNR